MNRLRALAAKPHVALATLLFTVYAYFYQAGGWNQNSRFDLVRAVVEDRSLRIDRFEHNTGDDSVRDGRWYCDKAPGASALCIPTYAVFFFSAGAPSVVSPGFLAWSAWASIVLAISVPSAIAAAFVARLARSLGLGSRTSVAVALGWALGTMALPYSTLLYGNQLAADLAVIAFALLVEVRGTSPSVHRMIAVGALLGYAGATEYPAALLAAPIAAYGLLVCREASNVRACAWAIAAGIVPIAALLAYHKAAFGSPFAFPYDFSVWKEPKTGWFMGIGKPVWSSLRNIVWGEYRGLFYTTPWLALAAPGAFVLWRRHRAEVLVCVTAVLLFFWLNSSIPPWHGGWAAGPRYLVPMLPFAAVLAGGSLVELAEWSRAADRATRIWGIGGLAGIGAMVAVSVGNMFAATAVKPEIETRWQRPYAEFVWPSFLSGNLSVSTQSIDMIDNPQGAPRQAWNLGMKLGLTGHASLLPLYALVIGCAVWLAWTIRRSEAA